MSGGVKSGGCSLLEAGSKGDPAPSGVGMKSSSGVSLSSSCGGAGDTVTGGTAVGGKYSWGGDCVRAESATTDGTTGRTG